MAKKRGFDLGRCVVTRLAQIERELREVPSHMADDTGRVTAHDDLVHNDDAVGLHRINRLTEERRSLRFVFERLERGEPMTCVEEDCGEQIPLERLKVLPSARRCFRCQTLLELTRPPRRFVTDRIRIAAIA